MKRTILIGLTVLAILALGVSFAAAQDVPAEPLTDYGTGFIDVNNDGICDNLGSQLSMNRGQAGMNGGNQANFVDADADGICDNAGLNQTGDNFVDADGDGVCDNLGTGLAGSQRLQNGQRGQGQGRQGQGNGGGQR